MGDGRRSGMVFSGAGGRLVDTVRSDQELLPDAYVAELAAFVDAVRAGAPAPVTGEDARAALAIALAAAESVRAGRPVRSRRWRNEHFRLAVSAEMVFVDLPFEERVRRISDAGFEVEIWDWTKKDVDALAAHRRHVLVDDRLHHRHARRPGRRGRAAAHRRGVDRGRGEARLPAAEPARHRPGRPGAADQAGRGRHARDVAAGREDARADRRAGRARRPCVHAGEPEHGRRPPRHAVREGRRHAGAGGGRRQPAPAS